MTEIDRFTVVKQLEERERHDRAVLDYDASRRFAARNRDDCTARIKQILSGYPDNTPVHYGGYRYSLRTLSTGTRLLDAVRVNTDDLATLDSEVA